MSGKKSDESLQSYKIRTNAHALNTVGNSKSKTMSIESVIQNGATDQYYYLVDPSRTNDEKYNF